MVVAEGDHELGGVEAEALMNLREEAVVDGARHAHVIGGDHDGGLAIGRAEGHDLGPKVMDLALSGALGAITGEPDVGVRGYDAAGEADLVVHVGSCGYLLRKWSAS